MHWEIPPLRRGSIQYELLEKHAQVVEEKYDGTKEMEESHLKMDFSVKKFTYCSLASSQTPKCSY